MSRSRIPRSAFRNPHSLDSASLSEIARIEKRRAFYLVISIIALLIAAACIYLAQS